MRIITCIFTLKFSSKWRSISMSHWSKFWIRNNTMNIQVMKKRMNNTPEVIGVTITPLKCFKWTVLYQITPQTLKWAQFYKNVCDKWKVLLEMRVFVCLSKLRIEKIHLYFIPRWFQPCLVKKIIGVKIWRVYLKGKYCKCTRISLSNHYTSRGNTRVLPPCIHGYSDKYW